VFGWGCCGALKFVYLQPDDRGYWLLHNPNRKMILTRESALEAARELTQLLEQRELRDPTGDKYGNNTMI
jgi:hypothetical protein